MCTADSETQFSFETSENFHASVSELIFLSVKGSCNTLYSKTSMTQTLMAHLPWPVENSLFLSRRSSIFLFSALKHMLWELISTEALLMSTHSICFHGEIR